MHSAISAYQQVNVQGNVTDASPHRLVMMLFDGARERLLTARGAVERGAIAEKGESIGKAISIIDGLRASLNFDHNKELAENLESLYAYMIERLTFANLRSEAAPIDEVLGLLNEVSSAWKSIGEDVSG